MTTLTRWFIILLLLVMVIAWNSIAGCAQAPTQVPVCEKFQYNVMTHRGEDYIVIDQQNAARLALIVEGLHNGTCRLEN